MMKAKLFRAVPFARTGWQSYAAGELNLPGDGMVRAFRSPLEVKRSAATFEGVPITVDHPADLLTADNAERHTVGIVSAVSFDDASGQLRADLMIWEPVAIGQVADGIRELSGGYAAKYEQRGGNEYDQVNIRGNHIALVPAGRSGSAQRIGG